MNQNSEIAMLWRDRAQEARASAEQLSDPKARRETMAIAYAYDLLAEGEENLTRDKYPVVRRFGRGMN